MKSEKAEAYINDNEMDAANLVDKDGCGWAVIGIHYARRAVELAEQEAEERMREKAIEAHRKVCFFRNYKDNTCANTATECGEHSCYYMNYLIQKLTKK